MLLVFQVHRLKVLTDDVQVELRHGGELQQPQNMHPQKVDLNHWWCRNGSESQHRLHIYRSKHNDTQRGFHDVIMTILCSLPYGIRTGT